MSNLLNDIKEYNQKLREKKEEFQRTEVQMKMLQESIQQKCSELTNMMGVQVTPDNLEQVYQEYVQKLQTQLSNGMAILMNIQNTPKSAMSVESTVDYTQSSIVDSSKMEPTLTEGSTMEPMYKANTAFTESQGQTVEKPQHLQELSGFDNLQEETSSGLLNSDSIFNGISL